MPRVCRNYQHRDFSYLLIPKQEELTMMEAPKVVEQPVVTPEKRRRDSLMSNRNMRFVISNTGRVHDRDCVYVDMIPDTEFRMSANLPEKSSICVACYRHLLVRNGLAVDQTKYMDSVMRFFQRINAENSMLYQLFFVHKATIFRVNADRVYILVNEDRWILQESDGNCLLFHNNYCTTEDGGRVMQDAYHLQLCRPVLFRDAVALMCKYTWSGHLQHMAEKQKAQRQEMIKKQLETLENYRLHRRFSLLFCYFWLAVPKTEKLILPCRILRRKTYENGELLLCRLPRWKRGNLQGIVDMVKAYCVEQECVGYADFCGENLPIPVSSERNLY